MSFFSIVIPTQNRADKLSFALKSVINQDFDDYKIIVSDNASSDSTKCVVDSISSPHIIYTRSDVPLPAIQSWEYARSKAEGDYVLLLGDDDVLVPGALSKVANVAKNTKSQYIITNRAWFDTRRSTTLQDLIGLRQYSYTLTQWKSETLLRYGYAQMYLMEQDPTIPVAPSGHSSSTYIARSLVDSIVETYGGFFLAPLGDLTSSLLCMLHIEQYAYVDEPLTVIGMHNYSSTTRLQRRELAEWGNLLNSSYPSFKYVPLTLQTHWNAMVESFLRVASLNTGRFESWGVYLGPHYYKQCLRDILNNTNVAIRNRYLNEYRFVVNRLKEPLRSQVRSIWLESFKTQHLLRLRGILGSDLYRLLRSTYHQFVPDRRYPLVKESNGNPIASDFIWIPAQTYNVRDIFDCACKLESICSGAFHNQ